MPSLVGGGAAMLLRVMTSWIGTLASQYRRARRRIFPRGHDRRPAEPRWFGPFSEGEWGDLERAFRYSKGTPYDVINRIASGKVASGQIAGIPYLDKESATIRALMMSTAELEASFPRGPASHTRNRPVDENSPIIALEADGKLLLLDGRTRINKWTAEANQQMHRVLVVAPKI